jgi:hypothetical protein
MVGIKRLVLVTLIVFAAVAGSTRGVSKAHAISCSGTIYAPVTSGSNVRGKASSTCSFTVCLEGASQVSGWSAPFACLSYGAGGPFFSSWYAGCGFGNAFRTVVHDASMPPGFYVAGPYIIC